MSYPGPPSNEPHHDPYSSGASDPYGQPQQPHDPSTHQPYGTPDPFAAQQPFTPGDPYAQKPYTQQPYGAPNPYAQQPYGAPNPYGAYAPGYGAIDPSAPYGRDPATGLPFSDKSKVAAGLLQIFLGSFGVGRYYIGDNTTGSIQLALTIIGWITAIFIVGLFIVMGVGLWALIDGILMLTGSVKDRNGLPLRS
ncbi:NINE protein [Gordonia sp. CPCC 206044]|uniref:TM2 domain-containing protein n=1 Tax=Gordonia sp. CPCC 206044 TaxID=3140793 RepID=UPI003AF35070